MGRPSQSCRSQLAGDQGNTAYPAFLPKPIGALPAIAFYPRKHLRAQGPRRQIDGPGFMILKQQ
ncbi:hypothetical protein C4K26_2421 [Pseudomonas chlororaphis]|nr:hypothetical protein C4K26_2421 [Pseudomonas chlororaphis]